MKLANGVILRWVAGPLLALLLVSGALSGCNSDTKAQEYRQIGSELTTKRSRMQQMSDYDYIANWQTKQYWPNEKRYVDAIPSAYRVYIQDKRTLDDFKGYTPGPR